MRRLKPVARPAPGESSSRLGSSRRQRRSRQEDHLATIFMGIILIFLVCHTPRVLLSLYEIATIHRTLECEAAGRPPFALWTLVSICVSHFLLVLNSATNMIVYCLLSSAFRRQCVATCQAARNAMCWWRDKS